MAAKNKAHSDDEMGQVNGKTIYHIKRKEGHAEKVGKFFDIVNEVQFAVAQRRGPQLTKGGAQRRRVKPNDKGWNPTTEGKAQQ